MVVRTYAPVGKTPVLKENFTRDHLSAMSAITLDGKLYMIEQDRAFKGEDAVRFLKSTSCAKFRASCWWSGMALRSIAEVRSKISSPAGQLLGCSWSNCPATHPISTLTRESGSTSSVWS